MNSTEQAAFDALVSELDAALARIGESPVRDNPVFSIEPDWFPELLCVTAERDGAADLRFMLDGNWMRVDISGLPESLVIPLSTEDARRARKHPPMSETLTRLLTSRVTVRYRRRSRDMYLADARGEVWGRNKYYGRPEIPKGFVEGEAREFAPLFPPGT